MQAALAKTTWGRSHQQWYALVDRDRVLAGARRYDLAGVLHGEPARICGIGTVVSGPSGNESHVRELLTHLVGAAEREGIDVALLFAADGLASAVACG